MYTDKALVKFAIAELEKARRKFAPEAHGYEIYHMEVFEKEHEKYEKFSAAIRLLERYIGEGAVLS